MAQSKRLPATNFVGVTSIRWSTGCWCGRNLRNARWLLGPKLCLLALRWRRGERRSRTPSWSFSAETEIHLDLPGRIRGSRYSMLVWIGEAANLGFFSTDAREPDCPDVMGHWKILSKSDLAPDYPDATLDVAEDEALLLFYPEGEEVRVEMAMGPRYE